jgi:hypothetical protein
MGADSPTSRTRTLAAAALAGGAAARGRAGARRGRAALLDRGGHDATELLEVHRLGEVVEGARLERLHRVLGRAVGGHHDAAFRALLRDHALQQVQAQAVRQPHVGDHRVEALLLHQLAGFAQRARGFHAVALAQQRELIQGAEVGFHDEHGRV